MSHEELPQELEEMGPVDWVVLGWSGTRPDGAEIAPMIIDLVDRGIIRVLDIAFVAKGDDGTVTALSLEHLGPDSPFAVFEGASTGLLDDGDLQDAAEALEPGDSAALLVIENRWAAPLAIALRRSGGQLLASGRIEIQALIAALDALDTAASGAR
jgi:dihydroorotase-like cyclic amidohydrolase